MVKQPFGSDQTIIKYLLNELSEDERSRFEEAYFGDGSLFEQVRALEEELIDDYVKGDLSGRDRRGFERHYLASAERRSRIETARQLIELCSLKGPARTVSNGGIGSGFFSRLRRLWAPGEWRLAPVWGVAAGALLLLSTGLVMEMMRLRGQLASVTEDRAAVGRRAEESERQLAQERDLLAEERKQGAGLREKLENLNSQSARPEQDRTPAQAVNNQIVFLALTPGGRGIYDQARAVISAGASFVELRGELDTPGSANPRSYRAVVKTDDGSREIWTQAGIKPQRRKPAWYVVVRIPADRFRTAGAQDFMLTLQALTADGKNYEDAESYYFQASASSH
jgi:hypothetical protein